MLRTVLFVEKGSILGDVLRMALKCIDVQAGSGVLRIQKVIAKGRKMSAQRGARAIGLQISNLLPTPTASLEGILN